MVSLVAIFIVALAAAFTARSMQRAPSQQQAAPETVFGRAGVLEESGSPKTSASAAWWLNSGGELTVTMDGAATMHGDAPLLNVWRVRYALDNSRDTDTGLHPQNLFRLVSRNAWDNVSLELHFFIVADNFSASPNRNASNGLLLMSRYTGDGQTLYYAGLRVDGTAVIKKKYHGVYYTLAQQKIFPGTYAIQGATSSRNLLPHGQWLGLRSTSMTEADGSILITLYLETAEKTWEKLLEATDRGGAAASGTPPIAGPLPVGIRTDFMDVKFSGFSAEELPAPGRR